MTVVAKVLFWRQNYLFGIEDTRAAKCRMTIADEIAKIEAMHKNGALSDEEFAKAKAAVLEPSQPTSPNRMTGPLIGYGFWLVILTVAGYFFVPWASQEWKEFSAIVAEGEVARQREALFYGVGVQRLDAELDQGIFSHDLLLVNKGDDVLTEATLDLTIIKEADGTKTELKQYWEKWVPGEKKKLNISASGTGSGFGVIASGFAQIKKDGESKKVPLANTWAWGKQ